MGELKDLIVGQRGQTHPATDTWMRGDRYGVVSMVGRTYVHVQLDCSGRTLGFLPAHLIDVNE
jgi:hypothetical protein